MHRDQARATWAAEEARLAAESARAPRGTESAPTWRGAPIGRLVAPSNEAPAKLGELLAIHDGDTWILGVVRRMQRQQVDEMTVGV